MASKALKAYAKAYKQMKAQQAICKDLAKQCFRDLNVEPDGKAVVDGVEFHQSSKVEKSYPKIQPILDKLNAKIKQLKETCEQTGEFKKKSTPVINASVPKSATKQVLAKSCNDYKKHFKIAA